MALLQPPRSWLRKMSEKTRISNQIQMKNIVNQRIDQNTWPDPNSARTMNYLPLARAPPGHGPSMPDGVARRTFGANSDTRDDALHHPDGVAGRVRPQPPGPRARRGHRAAARATSGWPRSGGRAA